LAAASDLLVALYQGKNMEFSTISDIQSWFNSLKIEENMISCNPYINFHRPYHLLTLALKAKQLKIQNIQIPNTVQNYSVRMHLWEAAGIQPPFGINESNRDTSLIPVRVVNSVQDIDEIATQFQSIIDYHYQDDEQNEFGIIISELLDNSYRHAGLRSEHALACVQTWKNGNTGQLCIADTGIGIRKTLSQNSDYLEMLQQQNACELATKLGYSGKLGKGHSGYGLAVTRGVIENNQGCLIILSGNEYTQIDENGCISGQVSSEWNGTLIVFEWNLDKPLDCTAVYSSWEGDQNDDEFDDMF